DAVMAQSIVPRACVMFDALTGDTVATIPGEAALRRRFGHPYIVIHRVDLHRVLLDACRATAGIVLEPSAEVVDYAQTGAGVSVTTADGRTITGSALIGADGLRSMVRARLVD